MAVIRSAVFSVSWTTPYPEALSGDRGRMVTRAGYADAFDGGHDLFLPWSPIVGPLTWSRFWSAYLATPSAIRALGPDAAWERVVPLAVVDLPALAGPADVAARPAVLLHPASVTVVVTVRVEGTWSVTDLPGALHALRTSANWFSSADPTAHRTLDGIAADLRDAAAPHLLADGIPVPAGTTTTTCAAPLTGDGNPAHLDLSAPGVGACLAGLASLGPAGHYDETRLHGPNSHTTRPARYYVLSDGLAVWSPTATLAPRQPGRRAEPLACLVTNQVDLGAQVAGLAAVVRWAADRTAARQPIPLAVRPLVRNCAFRLRALHEGRRDLTYRSGVATARVDPLLPDLAALALL